MEGQGSDYWSRIKKLIKARQAKELDHVNNYETGRRYDTLKAKHDYELAQLDTMQMFHGQTGTPQNVQNVSNNRTQYYNNNESYEG